ncbi:MAG: NAD-dependent epimerase/dehydratase family protein [Lachnospiraceae bacterium]|nr:NAD-dependent epimerase/dehydratase family protein [Lachnospiraceae bacterium]
MEYKVKDAVSELVYRDIEEIADTQMIPWEKLEGKTVLITGAAGFISYYMVLAFLLRNDKYQSGIKVAGLVRSTQRARAKYGNIAEREDFILFEQDVCEPFALDFGADYVIHAASQASGIQFEQDPVGTINANLAGTVQLLEYAKKSRSESVLLISSLKVYGKVTDGSQKLTEEKSGYLDQTSYKNCYAVGKRAMETLGASYHKQYGMNIRIARPSYIYGPSSLNDDRVWAQFIANVVKGEDILLKSNGGAYRSFCYVTDTVRALLVILLKGENMQPYNIASEKSDVTIRNFAKTAVQVFPEKNLKLSFFNKEDEAEPVVDYSVQTPEIMDSTRLEALGWSAMVDLAEGIRRSVSIVAERS